MKRKFLDSYIFYTYSVLFTVCFMSCNVENKEKQVAQIVRIDGSSTVYPLTHAIVERYESEFSDIKSFVQVSGTGGGFVKFANGETVINNASRKIKETEAELCNKNGVEYQAFEIAYDGIAVVVNKENTWVDYLTTEELSKIWSAQGSLDWSDIRSGWPTQPIKLFGPGELSGTYDYFKEAILGESSFTNEYTASENDNLIVTGISNSTYSLGFFGYSYFENNRTSLKSVQIDNGNGPVSASMSSIASGSYEPLSRTVYIYVAKEFLDSKEGGKFIKYYLQNVAGLSEKLGYVSLSPDNYSKSILSLGVTN